MSRSEPRPRVIAIQRTLASGPICGQVKPMANAVASTRARAPPVKPSLVSVTTRSAAMARVLRTAETSSTIRWPCRSARTPSSGAPRAEPIPTAPAAKPPAAYESLAVVTRVRAPTVSIARGSRAKRPRTRKEVPASRGSTPNLPRRDRSGRSGRGAGDGVGDERGSAEAGVGFWYMRFPGASNAHRPPSRCARPVYAPEFTRWRAAPRSAGWSPDVL